MSSLASARGTPVIDHKLRPPYRTIGEAERLAVDRTELRSAERN